MSETQHFVSVFPAGLLERHSQGHSQMQKQILTSHHHLVFIYFDSINRKKHLKECTAESVCLWISEWLCESTREGTRPIKAKPGREVSARAARGLRSRSKIAPQERPQPIGFSEAARIIHEPEQPAAAERPTGGAWGDQDSVRPPDEDGIWQCEMRLKGASRGHGHEVLCPRHV